MLDAAGEELPFAWRATGRGPQAEDRRGGLARIIADGEAVDLDAGTRGRDGRALGRPGAVDGDALRCTRTMARAG